MSADETLDDGIPLEHLRSSGMLWLINRVVFHPRGFALALHVDEDGQVTGWSISGDGTEPWNFTEIDDDAGYAAATAFLHRRTG